MPQMEFADYVPQVIWLIICFGCLYFLMAWVALPRVAEILENRQRKLDHDLESAERLRDEASSALVEYQSVLREASSQAEKIVAEARESAQVEAAERIQELNTRLEKQVMMSEQRLRQSRDAAEKEIRLAATELVQTTAAKLVGLEVSAEEAKRAIDVIAERG